MSVGCAIYFFADIIQGHGGSGADQPIPESDKLWSVLGLVGSLIFLGLSIQAERRRKHGGK